VSDNKIVAAEARRDEALDGSADPSFQALHEGYHVPPARVYAAVEAPKGEFGVYLIATAPTSRTSAKSARRLRPSAGDGLPLRGHLLADVSAILGSLDIVFGEVDR